MRKAKGKRKNGRLAGGKGWRLAGGTGWEFSKRRVELSTRRSVEGLAQPERLREKSGFKKNNLRAEVCSHDAGPGRNDGSRNPARSGQTRPAVLRDFSGRRQTPPNAATSITRFF